MRTYSASALLGSLVADVFLACGAINVGARAAAVGVVSALLMAVLVLTSRLHAPDDEWNSRGPAYRVAVVSSGSSLLERFL